MKVSIVLPAYNEANTIKQKLSDLLDYLKKLDNYSFDVVVVNDGSKDDTGEIVKSISGISLIDYQPNKGKGNAVREGLKASLDSDYIIFMDVDLATDLSALPVLLDKLNEYDMVIGSRYDKGSNIAVKQTFIRRVISRCSHPIIRMMFRLKVKDTQCGFKGYRKDLAKVIVEKSKMDGFSFDVEHLYIAKLLGYKYCSIPVTWRNGTESKVRAVSSSTKFFGDLFKIKRNKKWYKS